MNMHISNSLQRAIEQLPDHMHGGIYRYLEHGLPPGSFLTAVLSNDFYHACSRADEQNLAFLSRYGMLLATLPMMCWGSSEAVEAWIEKGGFNGQA